METATFKCMRWCTVRQDNALSVIVAHWIAVAHRVSHTSFWIHLRELGKFLYHMVQSSTNFRFSSLWSTAFIFQARL